MSTTKPADITPASQNKPTLTHNNRVDGLRSPGLLGKYPLIGLVMILLGSLVFGAMVVNLQTGGPPIQADVQFDNSLHDTALQSSPVIRDVMIFGFYMGEHVVILIGVVLLVYFVHKRFWPELWMVVIAWAGELAMYAFISQHYNRPRPIFDIPVWHTMAPPSFPSGHAIGAIMCYGLLAYLLVPKISSLFGKIAVIVVAIAICLYIGYSRLFIGDHYPTDVIAGFGLGFVLVGVVYTSVELICRRRKKNSAR